jgi:hypothetical protein
MTAMSILLFCRDTTQMPGVWRAVRLGEGSVVKGSFLLLWGAAGLAVWSLAAYFAAAWRALTASLKAA